MAVFSWIGLHILALTASTFYVCFLPFFLDGFIQSYACIMPWLRGSSGVSAPLPSLGEQRASPTPLWRLTCHVKYPKSVLVKISVRFFMPRRVAVIPLPACVAFEVSKQKSGGSIRDAGFKKLRPAREARGLQQATG